jgi:hypothetical protein
MPHDAGYASDVRFAGQGVGGESVPKIIGANATDDTGFLARGVPCVAYTAHSASFPVNKMLNSICRIVLPPLTEDGQQGFSDGRPLRERSIFHSSFGGGFFSHFCYGQVGFFRFFMGFCPIFLAFPQKRAQLYLGGL